MNVAIDVAAPTMVFTPLRSSSLSLPGCVGVLEFAVLLLTPFTPAGRLRGGFPSNEYLDRGGFASSIGENELSLCRAHQPHSAVSCQQLGRIWLNWYVTIDMVSQFGVVNT